MHSLFIDVYMDYTVIHDDHLLRLLKASDEGALKEIYLRYWKELYLIALKKIRSNEVAEELVQNVIVSLWDKRKITTIRNLEGYLKVAVKYQVINFIKGKIHQEKIRRNYYYQANSNKAKENQVC